MQGVINKSCKYSTKLRNELSKEEWNPHVCLKQLRLGARPEVKNWKGDTFLHRISNNFLLTKYITNTAQDFAVDHLDNSGRTALHHSLDAYTTPENVELLIKLGANPNTLNSEGKSYLFRAIDYRNINPGQKTNSKT